MSEELIDEAIVLLHFHGRHTLADEVRDLLHSAKLLALERAEFRRERDEARRLLDDARAQKPVGETCFDAHGIRWYNTSDRERLPFGTKLYAAAPVPAQPAAKTLYSFGADRVIRKHTTDNTKGIYVAELIGWDAGLLGDLLNSAPGAHPPDTYFKQPAAVPEAVAKDAPACFVEYMKKNYPPNTVIVDGAWHARPIWNAARAALLSAADTEVKNG